MLIILLRLRRYRQTYVGQIKENSPFNVIRLDVREVTHVDLRRKDIVHEFLDEALKHNVLYKRKRQQRKRSRHHFAEIAQEKRRINCIHYLIYEWL